MNTFFFGSRQRRLYGAFHPSQKGGASPGVVLCYPIGAEYMRSHRAFRQLTNLLTRAGISVFRFDYFGTGDSGGWGTDGFVHGWRDDIHTACEELKETAGLSTVSLIGLRLGASLASMVADTRDDVARLILWDAVIDGDAHVDRMIRRQLESMAIAAGPNVRSAPTLDEDVMGIGGFPYSRELRGQLRTIDLSEVTPKCPVSMVRSSPDPKADALEAAWKAKGVNIDYEVIPSQGNWDEEDKFGSALIPQAIIQSVVERMK